MQAYTKRRLVKDFAVILGIILLPLIVYIHLLFPNNQKTIDYYFFTLDCGNFDNLETWAWVGGMKLVHVLTFLLWRFTIKDWWRNVLFLPILFFMWQIGNLFDTEKWGLMESTELIFIGILSIPATYILYDLAKRFNSYAEKNKILNEIDLEIDKLINDISTIKNKDIELYKNEFTQILKEKHALNPDSYLKKLIAIKTQLMP